MLSVPPIGYARSALNRPNGYFYALPPTVLLQIICIDSFARPTFATCWGGEMLQD